MKKSIIIIIIIIITSNFSYSQIKLPKIFPTADYSYLSDDYSCFSYLSDNTMPYSTDEKTIEMYLNAMTVNWNYLDFATAQKMMNEVIKSDPIFAVAYAWKTFDSNLTEEKRWKSMNKAIEYSAEATESERIYIEAVHARLMKVTELQNRLINETRVDTFLREDTTNNVIEYWVEKTEPEIDWTEQWAVQIPYIQKIVSMHPDDFYMNLLLGVFYVQTGNAMKGKHYLYKALSLDKNSPAVRNLLGYAFLEMGNTLRAEKEFDKYINLLPEAANPYDSKGDFYTRIGQYAKAVEMYDKAYSINSSFTVSKDKADRIRTRITAE